MPTDDSQRPTPSFRPATHILSAASTMLGVTTTLIGLIKLLETQTRAYSVDEAAGGVVVMFLFAAVLSYASIRVDVAPQMSRRMERLADALFVVGLACLAVLTIVFAWDIL